MNQHEMRDPDPNKYKMRDSYQNHNNLDPDPNKYNNAGSLSES